MSVRRIVNEIAQTPSREWVSSLPPSHLTLIPLLFFVSTFYRLSLSVRRHLYRIGLFRRHSLPVPVMSVGNLTWGGNGKTPMVEYIARCFTNAGISPLILTRGYGGADEAKMLQRHFIDTSTKIGVGANRAMTAATFFQKYGYINFHGISSSDRHVSNNTSRNTSNLIKIGAAILDDGMQHLCLRRDIDIMMVNGMMPWGNGNLLPLGSLREPLTGLNRADVVVIHHADLVTEQNLEAIKSTIWELKASLPIFFSKMEPSYFLKADNPSCKLPLSAVSNAAVLCVSAIGSPDSFFKTIKMMGPLYVDRIDFSDHHLFQIRDFDVMRKRVEKLHVKSTLKPVVVLTEKDYDRDPDMFRQLEPYEVLILCSLLQIVPHESRTENDFIEFLKQCLS
ncbi:hypothetical protein Leryth_010126 [Lithospermum erythrorhizon]|nr:hypothetical protein Leryth_010126 [Lithospermum erythrorhizon]